MVLLAGGGILQKPAASNTGSSSRTRPGMLPSIIRLYLMDLDKLEHNHYYRIKIQLKIVPEIKLNDDLTD